MNKKVDLQLSSQNYSLENRIYKQVKIAYFVARDTQQKNWVKSEK